MKIYTRAGDQGQTSLGSGKRIKKSECLLEVLGSLDELNCLLGLCLNFAKTKEAQKNLPKIQRQIFCLGAEISGSPLKSFEPIGERDVKFLENQIDRIEAKLVKLRNFILPGGSTGSGFLHLSRAVCRRAERNLVEHLWRFHESQKSSSQSLIPFINRLSDYLFVLARFENQTTKHKEALWTKRFCARTWYPLHGPN